MKQLEWQSEPITIAYEGKPSYEILLEPNFGKLATAAIELGIKGRKIMILSDTTVAKYYIEECMSVFASVSDSVTNFVFPAGEASKNLDTVQQCYHQLINAGFDRNDVLVALGGGVVGDLTGFVAATYLRGIRFLQVPTSLLAMVDSSIGGKTGVDFMAYKNMVGAFHQPKLVFLNLSTLLSLPDREFYSGMGEIVKHGLIKDLKYYEWLRDNRDGIRTKNLEILKEMVRRSCLIKKEVVEIDPKETGDRALLNFGHTVGHSIERLKNFSLLHGECVSLGMIAAGYLSYRRGYLSQNELEEIISTLQSFDQPVTLEGLLAEEVYEVTRLDKKMDGDRIRFILLHKPGAAYIDPSVTKTELLEAISYILK